MLNQSFSNSLLFKSDASSTSNTSPNVNNSTQQCGICGKYPMVNGKTLVGCLHSFCQPCLIQSSVSNSLMPTSSIIACPICAQETLIPNGGIDALMPHYSNPILLSLNQELNSKANGNANLNSNFMNMQAVGSTASSPVGTNTNKAYIIQKHQSSNKIQNINNSGPITNSGNDLNNLINSSDLIDSSSNSYDQAFSIKKQLFQQQQSRLLQIESEIQKTFSFYVQSLNERRDYLLKEFHAIVQFVINQNQKNKSQQQKQRQFMQNFNKSSESNDVQGDEDFMEDSLDSSQKNNELQALINNYLMSIEFVTNLPAIQTSIYNTFGYIRYNSNNNNNNNNSNYNNGSGNSGMNNGAGAESLFNNSTSNNSQNHTNNTNFYKPKPIGPSSSSPPSYGHVEGNSHSIYNSSSNINNNNNNSNINSNNGVNNHQNNHHMLNAHGHSYFGTGNNNNNNENKSRTSMTNFNSNNNNSFQFNDHLDSSKHHNQQQQQQQANTNSINLNKSLSSSGSTIATSWSSVVAASTNRSNSTGNQNVTDSNLVLLTEENCQRLTNNSNASTLTSPQSTILSSSSSSSSSTSSSTCNDHHQTDPNTIEENKNQVTPNQLIQQNIQTANHLNLQNLNQSVGGLSSGSVNPLLPARSQLKRSKMIYNCKFGEFGVTDGQFTEPSGVAINSNNEIIVADTNSHRIQIFDREGRFKFKFGECGKREGQLLYPNRVAVVKHTGDIVVTERSPTHQIQIYNQYGHFLRKFGANILQHPRGVCVDSKGRIIVVECKVMRVLIFDLMGNVLQKFNCSKYLEFPNGCCCSNDREEIFISDNRAHCIKVFNYEGQYMRQIGGEGITNYPIGVGINMNGEVLVADNHNNFNLTVFTQDGQVINALESKVKHAQCFDVGLMDDGSIVLASKDYRIYVYRYNSGNDNSTAQENQQAVNMNGDNSGQMNSFTTGLNTNNINKPNNSLISSLTDFSF